ncbi:PQQ-binding-like beta-propeller repeat protein [Naumannella sp. ID2617S]|nr:PQQ-binding-like beta-propeller repeat protein [Naumannella sp. ID2617S]
MGLARRTLLAGALALGVAGCTGQTPPPTPEPPPPPPPPPVRLQTTRIPIAPYGELSSYSLAEDLLLLSGTGSYRSQVSAIDLAEGREVWRGDVNRLQGEPWAAGTGTLIGAGTVAGTGPPLVLLRSLDKLFALDGRNGQLRWTARSSVTHTVRAADSLLLVQGLLRGGKEELRALDRHTGALRWLVEDVTLRGIAGNRVLVEVDRARLGSADWLDLATGHRVPTPLFPEDNNLRWIGVHGRYAILGGSGNARVVDVDSGAVLLEDAGGLGGTLGSDRDGELLYAVRSNGGLVTWRLGEPGLSSPAPLPEGRSHTVRAVTRGVVWWQDDDEAIRPLDRQGRELAPPIPALVMDVSDRWVLERVATDLPMLVAHRWERA